MTLKEKLMKLQTYKMFEGEETLYVERDDVLKLLEQEPKTDSWSIKDVADTFKKHGLIREQEQSGDLISRDELLKAIDTWDKFGCDADTKLVPYQDHYIPYIHYDDVIKCIKGMPSVNPQEPKTGQFAEWVAREIFDDNWEYNKEAFAELACRKLAKLGIVRAKGDEWELVEPQESEEV